MLSVTDRVINNLETNQRVAPLYQIMAHALEALGNLRRPNTPISAASDHPWDERWTYVLEVALTLLPRGHGFDLHPTLCDVRTRTDRLLILGSYHAMDDTGGYSHWVDYKVMVKPDFLHGFTVTVIGGDNDFKDFVADTFRNHMSQPYDMNKFLLQIVRQQCEHERKVMS